MALGSIYNIEVKPEHQFHLKTGGTIKSLAELIETLKRIDDSIYHEHVTFERNDFSSWINDVFDLDELANKIKSLSKIDAIKVLSEELVENSDENKDKISNMTKTIEDLHKTINEPIREEEEPPRENIDDALSRLRSLYKEKRETESPSKIILHEKISDKESIVHLDGSEYEEEIRAPKKIDDSFTESHSLEPEISIRDQLAKRVEELENDKRELKERLRNNEKENRPYNASSQDLESKENELKKIAANLMVKKEEINKREREIEDIRDEYLKNMKDFVRQKKDIVEKEKEYHTKNNDLLGREEVIRSKEFELEERERDFRRRYDKYERDIKELREEINKLI